MSGKQQRQKRNRGDDPSKANKLMKVVSNAQPRTCMEVLNAIIDGRLSLFIFKMGGYQLKNFMPPALSADAISYDALSTIKRIETGKRQVDARITLQDWFANMTHEFIQHTSTLMPQDVSWGDVEGSRMLPISYEAIVCLSVSCTSYWGNTEGTTNAHALGGSHTFNPSREDVAWMREIWKLILSYRNDTSLFEATTQTATFARLIRLSADMNAFVDTDGVDEVKVQAMMAEDWSQLPRLQEFMQALVKRQRLIKSIMDFAKQGDVTATIMIKTDCQDPQGVLRNTPHYNTYNALMAANHQDKIRATTVHTADPAQVKYPGTFPTMLAQIQNFQMKESYKTWTEEYFDIDTDTLSPQGLNEIHESIAKARDAMFFTSRYRIITSIYKEREELTEGDLRKIFEDKAGKPFEDFSALKDGVDFMHIFNAITKTTLEGFRTEARQYLTQGTTTGRDMQLHTTIIVPTHRMEFMVRELLQMCWAPDFENSLKHAQERLCTRNYPRKLHDILEFETPATMHHIKDELTLGEGSTINPEEFTTRATIPIFTMMSKWKKLLRANWNSFPRFLWVLDLTKEDDRAIYNKLPLAIIGALDEQYPLTRPVHGDLAHDLLFLLLSSINHEDGQTLEHYDTVNQSARVASFLVRDKSKYIRAKEQPSLPSKYRGAVVIPEDDKEEDFVYVPTDEFVLMDLSPETIQDNARIMSANDARNATGQVLTIEEDTVANPADAQGKKSKQGGKPRSNTVVQTLTEEKIKEFKDTHVKTFIDWAKKSFIDDGHGIKPQFKADDIDKVQEFFINWIDNRTAPVKWINCLNKEAENVATNHLRTVIRTISKEDGDKALKAIAANAESLMERDRKNAKKHQILFDAALDLANNSAPSGFDAILDAASMLEDTGGPRTPSTPLPGGASPAHEGAHDAQQGDDEQGGGDETRSQSDEEENREEDLEEDGEVANSPR